MKKKIMITAGIILIILAVLITAGCIGSKPTYKVGFDIAHSPYTGITVDGDRKGLDYEALNWIAENQGFNVEYVTVPIGEYEKYLEDGSIDFFYSGVTVTDERKKTADFSINYIDTNLIAIGKKNGDVTVDDVLAGKVRVSGLTGSVGLKWYEGIVGTEKYNQMVEDGDIITRITLHGSLQDVETNEADVVITNDATAETYLKDRTHLMNIGIVQSDTSKAVAVKKGNTELLEKINAGLKNLMATDEWITLLKKYEFPAKQKVYKVGIDDTHSPYSYKDENGNIIGFDVECIEWIAEKYNFDVEFVSLRWSQIISAVANGNVDMSYSGITINDERLKKVTFSDPCYSVGMAVAKLKSNPAKIRDFDNQKLTIGVKGETTPATWIKSLYGEEVFNKMVLEGKIKLYEETPDVVKALENEEVDVIVMTDLTMNTQIKDKDNIQMLKTYGHIEELGIAFSNGNIALQYILNDGLKDLKSSGKYDELREKYNLP